MIRRTFTLVFAALALVLGYAGIASALTTAPMIIGMAGTNTQLIGGIYKTMFEDYVGEAVLNKFEWNKWFRFESAEYAGQEVVYTQHVKRNVSPMWVGEDAAFAEAGSQGYVKMRISQRKLMARVRITSEAMLDSMKSKGAYVSARKDEMGRLIDDIARMEEYAFTADGRGVLALIDDATPDGSATMTVDAPGGITGDDFGNRFFLPDMYVGAVNPATGELRSGVRKVISASADGTSLTFDATPPSTWADNDFLVQAADSSTSSIVDTSFEQAAWGLMGLFDDGTYRDNYFSQPRSLYPQFQSYVKASTGALSEDLFYQAADVIDQRLGGVIDILTMHHSIRRLINAFHQGDRRYGQASELLKPDPGTSIVTQNAGTFGGVNVYPIRTHPLSMVFGIDRKGVDLVRYTSEKGKWVDEDGRVLIRVGSGSSGRDSFEAWYRKRYQNHARTPAKAFRFDGITGQTLIVVREAGS